MISHRFTGNVYAWEFCLLSLERVTFGYSELEKGIEYKLTIFNVNFHIHFTITAKSKVISGDR
jgi:hypothetical protein